MKIAIINIEEKNKKAIRRYLRKWRIRKSGATLVEIACALELDYYTAKATLDWMLQEGNLVITRAEFEEAHYHA